VFAIYPFSIVVNRATMFIGLVSYGIYLIHPLVIATFGTDLIAILKGEFGLSGVILAIFVVLSVFITTFLFATVSYFGFELYFMRRAPRSRGADPQLQTSRGGTT
jgi:peptidoglycan/LPS O-acetylase OafA/YrhL